MVCFPPCLLFFNPSSCLLFHSPLPSDAPAAAFAFSLSTLHDLVSRDVNLDIIKWEGVEAHAGSSLGRLATLQVNLLAEMEYWRIASPEWAGK